MAGLLNCSPFGVSEYRVPTFCGQLFESVEATIATVGVELSAPGGTTSFTLPSAEVTVPPSGPMPEPPGVVGGGVVLLLHPAKTTTRKAVIRIFFTFFIDKCR